MTEKELNEFRGGAWSSLQDLEKRLNQCLPSPTKAREHLTEVVSEAQASKDKYVRRNALPEGAFLNTYIFPRVHEFLLGPGMSSDSAKRAPFL